MLSNYVGEDRFLKGVSLYLKEKLYANSVTKDLWGGIGKATGMYAFLSSLNDFLPSHKVSTWLRSWRTGS